MKHVLLLHGALGSLEQYDQLQTLLSTDFIVHTLNFSGHGGLAIPKEGFSIELFAKDVLNYLDQQRIDTINIFGYSMGGYVALYSTLQNSTRIKSVFTLATKFDWRAESASREVKMLDPEMMEKKIPSFVETLQERHAPTDWKNIVQQTANMMKGLSEKPLSVNDFQKIEIPVRLSVGARDQMVSVTETQQIFKSLKNGSLLVLPNTLHPFEKVNGVRLCNEIKIFFKE